MTQTIKLRIIKELVEEISYISAVALEYIGNNVISFKESQRLIHRGINMKDKPVKCTVDAYSEHSTIVVECSTEENYFKIRGKPTIKFKKIETDITKAVNHLPPHGPDKIYLITNQVAPGLFQKVFHATQIFKKYSNKLIIYDARELVNLIYEQSILNSDIYAFYREYLPNFALNMENYEYYGKVPSLCQNHIETPEIVDLISKHFGSVSPICVLHGISGSGKTQSTIQYVHTHKEEYSNYLWLSGEDWKPDSPLSSIQRKRGGSPINVSGIFNTQQTLLVIDSLERVFDASILEELMPGLKLGGRILVTSQISSVDSKYLPIPDYSHEVAMKILGEKYESISENGKKVLEHGRSVPIILSTINNMVKEEVIQREELYQEVLAHPEDVTGDDAKSILGRILSKLEPKLLAAFKKIANTGSSYHDGEFLVHFVGGLLRSNLQKISLLLPAGTPGIVKAHDLLLKSIRDDNSFTEISEGIESYLEIQNGEMTPGILREIHLCYDQLCAEDARRGKRTPDWITYALIQIEGNVRNDICKKNYFLKLEKELPLSAIMSIIDAKETHAYTLTGEAQDKFYKKCLEDYQIAHGYSTDEAVRFEYLHHIGKTQGRCKQYVDALNTFNLIIEAKPDWHAASGQIAKLGAQHGAPISVKVAGEEAMKKLLDSIFSDRSKVPLRVALAMISQLRSYKSVQKELSNDAEKVQKLSEVIATSGLEGFGQFFEAYVSFTSMFGYEYSDIVIDLADQFYEILMQTPTTVDERQWLSACEGLVNTANAAKDCDRSDLFEKLRGAALQYVTQITKCNVLDKYEVRALAKAYNIFEEPQNALEIIGKFSEEEVDHWVQYQRAKAKYQLNDYTSAEIDAYEALQSALSDRKARNMLSSYHDLYSQCLEKNGNLEDAIKELENAIEKTDGKYKTSLEKRKLKLVENYDQSLNI